MKMKLMVTCPGVTKKPELVHCGDGSQAVKWLGVTLSQRFQSEAKPRGRMRRREQSGIQGGFYAPSHVTDQDGRVLDPLMPLKDAFVDGATAVVHMQVLVDRLPKRTLLRARMRARPTSPTRPAHTAY
jgi:hypothetical protein